MKSFKLHNIMRRGYKITAWIAGGLVLLGVPVFGAGLIKDALNPEFEETEIFPNEGRPSPADTTLLIEGIPVKMIGVKGGKINCQGLKDTIELDDFYIGETEVTQELWTAIMGENPSVHQSGDSLPVENINLVDCLEFVSRLDSISDQRFYIPSYAHWLYAGYSGKQLPGDDTKLDGTAWHKENSGDSTHRVKGKMPDSLGLYDMLGNVAEWTLSGSDPLFIVAGKSFETEKNECNDQHREFVHCDVKMPSIGLRLVYIPEK